MAPPSQELEPPANPERFIDGEAVACDETGIARFEVCSGQLSGLCGRLFWRAVEPLNLGRNLVPPGGQVREFSFEVWVSDF
jgi:hypothetical protein